jgi:hypothetical protein
MKTKFFTSLLIVLLSLGLSVDAWSAGRRGGGPTSVVQPLTQGEIDTLKYMREEEKMARDLYLSFDQFYAASGVRVFGNIARSEQKHMDAVKKLLTTYGIEDPVTDNTVGVFANEELKSLYQTLLLRGEANLVEAFKVGVLVEETDLVDLAKAIAETDKTNIERVYQNLLKGSENHLKAFNRQLQ